MMEGRLLDRKVFEDGDQVRGETGLDCSGGHQNRA
jgi:hypothetical protein